MGSFEVTGLSKYSLAKSHLEGAICSASSSNEEPSSVVEALIVLAIQELKSMTSRNHARNFLQYEMDSLGSGGVYEIQKR